MIKYSSHAIKLLIALDVQGSIQNKLILVMHSVKPFHSPLFQNSYSLFYVLNICNVIGFCEGHSSEAESTSPHAEAETSDVVTAGNVPESEVSVLDEILSVEYEESISKSDENSGSGVQQRKEVK